MAGYDAFISYSHGADLELAPVVRDGLQKLAKPWNRRRALSIFLDQASLELSSELGSSLDDRIEDTRWLVLFMSEESAQSKWVGAEIKEWAEKKSKDQMALVLTSGEVFWDDHAKDFDYERSTAVNEGMRGIYTGQDSEPLYLDLRWAKEVPDGMKSLDLDHARFRSDIATMAAPVHGKAKDELEGEDLRQFRLARRLKRTAIAGLAILTIIAIAAGIFAWTQRNQAIAEEKRAVSRALASDALNNADRQADLAALLALEGVRVSNTTDARGSLVELLSRPSRFLQRIDRHDAPVSAIAFSTSGRVAASGDEKGTITIWDVGADPWATTQAVPRGLEIPALRAKVSSLFVDDDDTVIAFDEGGNLYVIDGQTGELELVDGPQEFIRAQISPGFGYLAGTTEDWRLYVYEIVLDNDGLGFEEVGLPFEGVFPYVTDLTFSPDESEVAWGEDSGEAFLLVLWNWQEDTVSEHDFDTEVMSIAYSPDNTTIAVGELEGNIHLFDRNNLDLTDEVQPPPVVEVNEMVFKPSEQRGASGGYTLASAHKNGEIKLWSIFPGEDDFDTSPFGFEDDTLLGHNEETTQVAFNADGRIASGSFDGEIIWWSDVLLSRLGQDWRAPTEETSDMNDAAFVDPTRFASLDDDGSVWMWDYVAGTGEVIHDGSAVWSLDAAQGRIAVGLVDGSALVLEPDGSEVLSLRPFHPAPVDIVALSSNGADLLTVSSGFFEVDPTVAIWDVATGSMLTEPTLPDDFVPESAFYGDDGSVWLGGRSSQGPIALKINATTGAEVGRIQHNAEERDRVTALALSDDGATLASGGSDRLIKLWNTETLEQIGDEFNGHKHEITGIVFSDRGETLISSDRAGEVVMWDVSSQRRFAVFGGPSDGVNALEVSGDTLLAASDDDAAWTWTLNPAQWRERACDLAGRNMTVEELAQYAHGSAQVSHCPQWLGEGEMAEYSEQLSD